MIKYTQINVFWLMCARNRHKAKKINKKYFRLYFFLKKCIFYRFYMFNVFEHWKNIYFILIITYLHIFKYRVTIFMSKRFPYSHSTQNWTFFMHKFFYSIFTFHAVKKWGKSSEFFWGVVNRLQHFNTVWYSLKHCLNLFAWIVILYVKMGKSFSYISLS